MKKTIACVIIGFFIVLAGCATTPGGEISTSSSSIQPIGDSAPAGIISGFFAGPGMQDRSWRTESFILNSFQELTEVYSYVSDPENWYCLRYLNGSAYSDFVAGTYSEDYFNDAYIIAVLATASCSDWIFDCSATKSDDGVTVSFNGTLGDSPLEDLGRFVYLVPVNGSYSGEKVVVVRQDKQVAGAPLPDKGALTE